MINTFENFQKMYQEKLMTADEAVKSIKSGDTIAYGEFVTVPYALDAALARRVNELYDIDIDASTSFTRFSSSFAFAMGSSPETWFCVVSGRQAYAERLVVLPVLDLTVARTITHRPAATAQVERNAIGALLCHDGRKGTFDLWQNAHVSCSSLFMMTDSSMTRSVVRRLEVSMLLHITHSMSSTTRATPSLS